MDKGKSSGISESNTFQMTFPTAEFVLGCCTAQYCCMQQVYLLPPPLAFVLGAVLYMNGGFRLACGFRAMQFTEENATVAWRYW